MIMVRRYVTNLKIDNLTIMQLKVLIWGVSVFQLFVYLKAKVVKI